MKIIYNKLVRDRIPEIIESKGQKSVCTTLSDQKYLAALDEKLNEELAEYQQDKSMEELADLLEVIRAVIAARGSTYEQVESIRLAKKEKRGGFEKRIWLETVEDSEKNEQTGNRLQTYRILHCIQEANRV